MSMVAIPPNFVRSALRLALCYVIALQAILAASASAFAVGGAGGTAASFAICHSASQDVPSRSGDGTASDVPCAVCATMASAGSMPPQAGLAVTPPSSAGHDLSALAMAGPRGFPNSRAGLARAPPPFA